MRRVITLPLLPLISRVEAENVILKPAAYFVIHCAADQKAGDKYQCRQKSFHFVTLSSRSRGDIDRAGKKKFRDVTISHSRGILRGRPDR